MARARKSAGGRGSAEAIEKRRVARQLNTLFSGKSQSGKKLDGRTEKRRQRLLKELKEGKGGEPLKAIEIVTRAHELLRLGETVSSIRKSGVKAPKGDLPPEASAIVSRTQAAYSFDADAWKLLGINIQNGKGAAQEAREASRRGRRKGARTKATRKKTKRRTSQAASRR